MNTQNPSDLLALAPGFEQHPFAADGGDAVEPVARAVLVPVVAHLGDVRERCL